MPTLPLRSINTMSSHVFVLLGVTDGSPPPAADLIGRTVHIHPSLPCRGSKQFDQRAHHLLSGYCAGTLSPNSPSSAGLRLHALPPLILKLEAPMLSHHAYSSRHALPLPHSICHSRHDDHSGFMAVMASLRFQNFSVGRQGGFHVHGYASHSIVTGWGNALVSSRPVSTPSFSAVWSIVH